VKVYAGTDIRNVAVIGHGNSGKTSLVAGMLYASGATNRLTSADEGNTLTDFDEEEINRKITISTSLVYAEWNKTKINLLDTPGFNIFINDAKAAVAAADSALVMVDAVAGVEVQTEKTWGFADEYNLPRLIVVNKMERERADFKTAVASIQDAFGREAVPVQLPLGHEAAFHGVVDLIAMKAYTYEPDGNGKGKEQDIPADVADAAQEAHEALVEMVAEGKDELMEEFFEKGTLPTDHIVEGLREAVADHRLFPIFCASASHNIGTDRILSFIADSLPSPVERPAVAAKDGDEDVERPVSNDGPPVAFVFKTVADAFAGRVSYFKVMSGVLKNDVHLNSSRADSAERLAHIGCLMGKDINPVNELNAGDIGAVAKLKDTLTGDILHEKGSNITYPPVDLPEPSIGFAVTAASRNDEDRMGQAISKILEEDPSMRFYRDPQTNEFLLAGSGQQQVEVIVSKLNKRYNVNVELHAPKIPYRETIRGSADVQGRHKKQTGGHGQFGDCRVKFSPLPRGGKFEFVNSIFGGAIPKTFIPAVEKGILEAAAKGHLAGFPVVDFKAELHDGKYHDVDSNEMSFKMAGRKAFREAMQVAKPAILEPIMKVDVQTPGDYAGDLMGDMNGRRGRISGSEVKGNNQVIMAFAPMSEMLTYQNDLTSMTQGRASFHMEFDHYDYVPQHIADKIVAAAKAAREGLEEEDE
jgi:elongation factor G